MNKTALVLLAPGFEEIESVTAIDVLRRAEVEVTVASVSDELIVRGSRMIRIEADMLLKDFRGDADCIVLPGGVGGAEALASSQKVMQLVKEYDAKKKIIAAICAAPACVLTGAGIISGREITCYPEFEDIVSEKSIYRNTPVVVSDNIITSQGVGTAIQFALAIVETLVGKQRAQMIKKAMVA